MFSYTGAFGVPAIGTVLETAENHFWWNRYEDQVWQPALLSGAARDAGNSVTNILRPGLLLGQVSATGKIKEWNPTGTDGSQRIWGILGHSFNMQSAGTNKDRFAWAMVAGMVKPERLLVPGQSSFGLSGQTVEFQAYAQMFGRFMAVNNLLGNMLGGWRDVVAKTADYTVLEADNNTLFTNRGASGAVTFTLPTTPKKGLRYGFSVAADQNVVVAGGTADNMIAFNNATADSVSFATSSEKVGGHFEIIGDGTGWLVLPHAFGLGATAQTITTTDA